MRNLRHIFHLGIKEMLSLARDPVLLFLIAYCFTFSVYTPANIAVMDVINASVALVYEHDSQQRRHTREAWLPRLCRPARLPDFAQITHAMNTGQFTFIIDLPRKSQSDISRAATPTAEIIADATVMAQAGRGPGY